MLKYLAEIQYCHTHFLEGIITFLFFCFLSGVSCYFKIRNTLSQKQWGKCYQIDLSILCPIAAGHIHDAQPKCYVYHTEEAWMAMNAAGALVWRKQMLL